MFAAYCVIFLWRLIDLERGGKDPPFGLPWAAWSQGESTGGSRGTSPFLEGKNWQGWAVEMRYCSSSWEGREQHPETPKWNLTQTRKSGKNPGLGVWCRDASSIQETMINLIFHSFFIRSSVFSLVYNQNYFSFQYDSLNSRFFWGLEGFKGRCTHLDGLAEMRVLYLLNIVVVWGK